MERRARPNSPKAKTDDALSPSAPMPDRKYKLGSQFPADRPRLFFRLVAPASTSAGDGPSRD